MILASRYLANYETLLRRASTDQVEDETLISKLAT